MNEEIKFIISVFGSREIEFIACFLGLANVLLIVYRSIWNYPFGIAMVSLYAWIFFDYRLYAEAGLQVYFFGIQLLGWWWWINGRGDDGRVKVRRAPVKELMICVVAAALVAVALGWALSEFTDADLPYWDSSVAALSIVAQYLLARRFLESWPVWIVVDVLAIGIYVTKGLHPTAVLYSIFLCMAAAGLVAWNRAYKRGVPVAA